MPLSFSSGLNLHFQVVQAVADGHSLHPPSASTEMAEEIKQSDQHPERGKPGLSKNPSKTLVSLIFVFRCFLVAQSSWQFSMPELSMPRQARGSSISSCFAVKFF